MKIKIIELLNKIANKEEIHCELFYKGEKYYLLRNVTDYRNLKNKYLFKDLFSNEDAEEFLNDEVEIIEEDKKIEKMFYCEENTFKNMKECTYLSPEEKRLLDSNFKELGDKINEIIEKINEEVK